MEADNTIVCVSTVQYVLCTTYILIYWRVSVCAMPIGKKKDFFWCRKYFYLFIT